MLKKCIDTSGIRAPVRISIKMQPSLGVVHVHVRVSLKSITKGIVFIKSGKIFCRHFYTCIGGANLPCSG